MKTETKKETEYDYAATIKKLEAYEIEGAKKYTDGAKPKASLGNSKTGPSQLAQAAGKKWTCSDCAAHRCGCFGKGNITFKKH